MPIRVYQPQVAPATPKGNNRAAVQRPVRNYQNTQTLQLVKQADQTMESVAQWQQRKEEDRMAVDLINAELEYSRGMMEYENDYMQNNKRGDAKNAMADWESENKRMSDSIGERFAGNPKAQAMWMKSTGQMTLSSLRRANQFTTQEDAKYRDETAQGLEATYYQKITTLEGNDKAIDAQRAMLNTKMAALYPGQDLTAMMAKIDLNTATTRINTAVAKDNYGEANRLLKEYKPVLGTSYDEAANHVEASRKVANKEAGSQLAIDAFNSKRPASDVWDEIAKIKDEDMRNSASRQYSSMWTMQKQIDEEAYKQGAIKVTNDIEGFSVNDVGNQQAYVEGLPEQTEVQRRTKAFAQAKVDANKAGIGIDKGSDAGSYMDIREDILNGKLLTKEQIESDPRYPMVTENDGQQLVKSLEATQKATDQQINDAGRAAFGAQKWDKMNKNKKFSYLQQVRAQVEDTNRGQDTDYIQSVMDKLATEGERKSVFYPGYGENTELGDAIRNEEFTPEELDQTLDQGAAVWLPSEVPEEFKEEWNAGAIPSKNDWEKLYSGDKAMKAAYLRWLIDNTGTRQ